ncbi:hypothetical protein QBC41DRAFT_243147, partial [Cercophora samala]
MGNASRRAVFGAGLETNFDFKHPSTSFPVLQMDSGVSSAFNGAGVGRRGGWKRKTGRHHVNDIPTLTLEANIVEASGPSPIVLPVKPPSSPPASPSVLPLTGLSGSLLSLEMLKTPSPVLATSPSPAPLLVKSWAVPMFVAGPSVPWPMPMPVDPSTPIPSLSCRVCESPLDLGLDESLAYYWKHTDHHLASWCWPCTDQALERLFCDYCPSDSPHGMTQRIRRFLEIDGINSAGFRLGFVFVLITFQESFEEIAGTMFYRVYCIYIGDNK